MNVWLIAQETDAFTRWHAHVGPIDAEVKRIFVGHTCSLPGVEPWSPPAPPHHHPDDPVRPEESAHWPFNILCPATALSWWIADQVQARLTDEDHPTHIVALEDPLLLYFLAQRQAIDASFLPHTQLAITLDEPWLPSPQERLYRLPLYWQDEVRRAACWMARDLFQYNPQTEPTVRQLLSDDTNEAPLYAITELKERFLKTSLVEQSSDTFPFADAPLRKGYCIEALPESPELTVIIPCYNLGNYVDEAIESALASEGVDFSILLVDDGSTDPLTQERLDAWEAREEPRLKIIRRTNHGLAATRNFGAAEAQTPYLAFLDADDAVEPDFFRKALTILQRYRNVHHVSTWVRTFGDQDGIWSAWNTTLPFFLGHNLFIPICVVRRESFLRFGQNKPAMRYGLEDYEGWLSMVENGCGGVALPDFHARYRVRNQSMFQSINRTRQLFLYDLIVREHPDLYRKYGEELFCLLNANGPAWAWDLPTCWIDPYERLLNATQKPPSEDFAQLKEAHEALNRAHGEAHRALQWHQHEREHLLRTIENLRAQNATQSKS